MTVDAELTLTQVQIMENVANQMPVFIMGISHEDDDEPTKKRLRATNKEVDQLVALGFITNMTDKNLGAMAELEQNTGHKHRVFVISEVGRAFFDGSASRAVN